MLPIIFPKTISECPLYEATEFTINYGADVPKATIVKPIAKSEILFCPAREEAPSTSQFARKTKAKKPIKSDNEEIIIINNLYQFFIIR